MTEREHHRADHEQRRADDAGPDAARGIGDAGRLHLNARMFAFPGAKLPVAQRLLFSFVVEDVERLGRLGQKGKVDEGRRGRENGPAPFDADIEKDVGRAGEDEIGGEPEEPEDGALEDGGRGERWKASGRSYHPMLIR